MPNTPPISKVCVFKANKCRCPDTFHLVLMFGPQALTLSLVNNLPNTYNKSNRLFLARISYIRPVSY